METPDLLSAEHRFSTATETDALAAKGPEPQPISKELAGSRLQGKRVAMIMFSFYPSDPRPRRAAEAILREGASIDLICLRDESSADCETVNGVNVRRISIKHRRGGKLTYAYQYFAFIFVSAWILAVRSLIRRYDLVYVHNMPDVLVASALIPKIVGSKIVLDQHDPMPELMTTIFGLEENSSNVNFIKKLEKWSFARAHLIITVNQACRRLFTSRSCSPSKIGIVMNAPDGKFFPVRAPRTYSTDFRPSNSFGIMYHGSLVERNGLDLAVKALARVRQAVPNAELWIYGRRTPFLERVLEQAADLGLRESVRYRGSRSLEELAAEIECCAVGIIPNQRNAFTEINTPTRIFEYLALGKPVVAPHTAGILDYFENGSLLFFEPGSSEELAEKIMFVYSHAHEAMQIAERGQQVYLAHTWNQERQQLVSLLGSLFDEA